MPELTSKEVTCRKPHRCDWCGVEIPAGERARYRAGVFDAAFYSGHEHPECHAALLRSDLGPDDSYEVYTQGRGKSTDESEW